MSDGHQQYQDLSTSNKLLPAESWDYVPAKERFRENAISMGVMVGYGLVLSQIFNPIAFFFTSALSLLMGTVVALSTSIGNKPKKDQEKKPAKKQELYPIIDGIEKIDPDDPVHKHYTKVLEIYSEFLEIPKQRLFFAGKKTLLQGSSFWEKLQFRFFPEEMRHKLKHYASSNSTSNSICVTRDLVQGHEESVLNVVLAHEVFHAKANDSGGIYMTAKMMTGMVNTFLKPLALGTLAGSLMFPTFPSVFAAGLNAVVGASLFLVSSIGANLGFNYVSRIFERRADRNAIFLTRDLASATRLFASKYQDEPAVKKPKLFELRTHPSFGHRLQNVQDAFVLASQYEPVKLNLPEPPREVLESKNNPALKI